MFKHKDYDGKSNVIIYVNSRVSIEQEQSERDGDIEVKENV